MSSIEKLKKIVSETNLHFVTYADVKTILDSCASMIKKTRAEILQITAKNRDIIEDIVKKTNHNLIKQEEKLMGIIGNLEQKQVTSISLVKQQLSQEVNSIREALPKDNDLAHELEELEAQVNKHTELFTSENVRNMLELLEGDERLKVSAISGLDDFFKRFELLHKTVKGLKGAASVPSPMHVPTFEKFTMNGSDTSVTLAHAVGAAGHAIFNVTYQGQVLHREEHYTVNGNKISFVGFTPGNGKIISISYMP